MDSIAANGGCGLERMQAVLYRHLLSGIAQDLSATELTSNSSQTHLCNVSPKAKMSHEFMRDWLGTAVERDLRLASLWRTIGVNESGFLNDTEAIVQSNPTLKPQIEEVQLRHENGDYDPDEDRFSISKACSERDNWPVQLVKVWHIKDNSAAVLPTKLCAVLEEIGTGSGGP